MKASASPVRFRAASDQSLLVYLDGTAASKPGERVIKLLRLLQSQPLPHVRNLHPAYASLLIKFDPLKTSHAGLEAALQEYLAHADAVPLPPTRLIDIPVCYGADFGPDLAGVAAHHRLTAEQVVRAHTAASYTVCFLGFAPGFAYLAGLPDGLITPRLATPRRQAPPGSVGIGGKQTGVYPLATPGGWRIIGRTPLKMFSPSRAPMGLLSIGDTVRFLSISREQAGHFEQA